MAEVVAGLGFRPGAHVEALLAAVRQTRGEHRIRYLATVDRRAEEPGLTAAATELAVPVLSFTPEELAEIEVPHPAARTAAAIGTPSVAEAAALLAAGTDRLMLPKQVLFGITIAIAEMPGRRP
ncbi:cobalamin biosynthesis protein [Nocardia sp. NPDC051570]|uniref:cobalamin biosynthesis protein n=1 Tax=Nocardia sp. NPDC051570 TaxID=3364324 RepID=UPI00379928D6